MKPHTFDQEIAAGKRRDFLRRKTRRTAGVIGLFFILAGLGYFSHLYFNLGGRLLLSPRSAPVSRISGLKKAGACRFEAKIERSFSLLAIALERESYKATDGTGKIKVDFPHTIESPGREVWIVGICNSHGNAVKAVWIGKDFSWHLVLEALIPIILLLLGAVSLIIFFRPGHMNPTGTPGGNQQ